MIYAISLLDKKSEMMYDTFPIQGPENIDTA